MKRVPYLRLGTISGETAQRVRAELVALKGGEENYQAWLQRNILAASEGSGFWLNYANAEIARLKYAPVVEAVR